MAIGISLGWNCKSAAYATDRGIRKTKSEGYKTCPFDIMVSNYHGLIQCLNDDFKYFTDPEYLKIVNTSNTEKYNPGEKIIHNTRYGFIFNHESPDHGKLYVCENWPEGKNHYINNNFKNFIERYNRRIQNFRDYMHSGEEIIFTLNRPQKEYTELMDCLSIKYPSLTYNIVNVFNKSEEDFDLFYWFHKYMGLQDDDTEIVSAKNIYE